MDGFVLIEGTCPCHDLNCVLCKNGFPNSDSCFLCKNDYYSYNQNNGTYKCHCKINNCKICSNNLCLKCEDNYYYDNKSKTCIEKKK